MEGTDAQRWGGGRLSRRRYSCPGGRPWVRNGFWREPDKIKGVILSEPWFAQAKEEGEAALGLDGEKVFSPK